ncbi:SDR family NAD(P)-dependent oxidoreductase [Periweissella cryptocerci]|uniref:SDR family NAD(P)-dependent oxidoreductase n=1 Tax=Periweissella cryptocerci TaxID=2506420 RepID=A0A4P6YRH0_9LACO|nr:oxidoreductase [Periweissella cryptocerci]QBO35211.1 SDR family NAD(P)-dependent oxidoreductase [Periweissella cryptocerci]
MTKQVVIITGISSGMGRAAALLFNQRNWIVYGGARRIDQMADLAAAGIHVQALDVTDEASTQAIVNRVIADQGRIDVLINNAGYGEYGALEEVTMAKAKAQFDVNVFGLANMTQLVLPTMRAQHSGRIINNSSIGGRVYMPIGGWYHASKHALEVYSDVLRMEVQEFGINVSVIEPGGTATEWADVAMKAGKASTANTSPYAKYMTAFDQVTTGNTSVPLATPEKIAELMWQAATAKKPKLRYLPGFFERAMVFAARHLPVRTYQALTMSTFKRMMK